MFISDGNTWLKDDVVARGDKRFVTFHFQRPDSCVSRQTNRIRSKCISFTWSRGFLHSLDFISKTRSHRGDLSVQYFFLEICKYSNKLWKEVEITGRKRIFRPTWWNIPPTSGRSRKMAKFTIPATRGQTWKNSTVRSIKAQGMRYLNATRSNIEPAAFQLNKFRKSHRGDLTALTRPQIKINSSNVHQKDTKTAARCFIRSECKRSSN